MAPNRFPHEAEDGPVDEWFTQMASIPPRSLGPYRVALIALIIGPLPETIDYFLRSAAHSARHSLILTHNCENDLVNNHN